MNNTSLIKLFFRTGLLEALSYILLLGIAMPMKYFLEIPAPVKYLGWAHGFLFMGYLALLAVLIFKNKWNLSYGVYGCIAAMLPFGPFVFEKYLKKQENLTPPL